MEIRRGSRFLGFLVSWFLVPWILGFLCSWFLVSWFLVSWLSVLDFLAAWLIGFLVSELIGFKKPSVCLKEIGTILQKIIFMFLIDIHPISKISKKCNFMFLGRY